MTARALKASQAPAATRSTLPAGQVRVCKSPEPYWGGAREVRGRGLGSLFQGCLEERKRKHILGPPTGCQALAHEALEKQSKALEP